jgi:hypothetical protein
MIQLESFMKQYLLRYPSDTINARSLAANTAEDMTIPAGATCVVLSGTDNFYVQTNGNAATVPGDTTDGTAAELNQVGLSLLNPVTGVVISKLSVISAATCVVTASFYK